MASLGKKRKATVLQDKDKTLNALLLIWFPAVLMQIIVEYCTFPFGTPAQILDWPLGACPRSRGISLSRVHQFIQSHSLLSKFFLFLRPTKFYLIT